MAVAGLLVAGVPAWHAHEDRASALALESDDAPAAAANIVPSGENSPIWPPKVPNSEMVPRQSSGVGSSAGGGRVGGPPSIANPCFVRTSRLVGGTSAASSDMRTFFTHAAFGRRLS